MGAAGVRKVLSLTLLSAFAAAGSARAADAPRPTPIDACGLLTPDDIASVTGKKAGAPISGGDEDTSDGSRSSTCVWKLAGDAGAGTQALDAPLQGSNYAVLNIQSWPQGSDGARKFVEDFRDAAEHDLIPAKPVTVQVGDEALYWGDGVAVRKGNVSFGISVHLVGGKPTEQAMEEALAKTILGKLK